MISLLKRRNKTMPLRPKLYRIILPVDDIEKAAGFYEGLLGFGGQRVSPGRHYFDCDGTILACLDPRADGEGRDTRSNPEHIYFCVADLEAVFERAKVAGCRSIDGSIVKQPWGERMFYAVDPFGNQISFVDERTVFTG
jgi:predicted enzyme related to lactoylglutathione lyase